MCRCIAQSVSGTCGRLHLMNDVSKYSKEINILMKRFQLVFSYSHRNMDLCECVISVPVCWQHIDSIRNALRAVKITLDYVWLVNRKSVSLYSILCLTVALSTIKCQCSQEDAFFY